MAKEEQTLHVHFGRKHSVKKQCGLCDRDFNDSEQLDAHLTQCEIFVCCNSGCKKTFEKLPEMKNHIEEEHKKDSPAHYSFPYYIFNAKDKSEKEISKQYLTIYPKDW